MRLVLIDDHPLVLQALRTLLPSAEPSIEIVGEASTARDAITVVEHQRPQVVLLDVVMPGTSGVTVTRDIRRLLPSCRILVYTAIREAAVAMDLLAAGAHGYALKSDSVDSLIAALLQTASGQKYVSPSMSPHLDPVTRDSGGGLNALSTREREVFDLLIKGHSSEDLAGLLFISVKTIETHRARINKKLGVHSTAQIVRLAALMGLIQP